MTDVLRHRGPDGEGYHASDLVVNSGRPALPGVALGHRRLAIIDVAGSRQPMANESKSVWVVFNGEIYNYLALRRRLEGRGHQVPRPTATRKHLSISMKMKVRKWSACWRACSRSPSGMPIAA